MAYPPKIQAVLDDLEFFPDRADRIQALISIADRFEPVPPEVASPPYPESHRVEGCESEVFVWMVLNEHQKPRFYFAVENPQGVSAKAMAVILGEGLAGLSLSEIGALSSDLIYDIFGRDLSMGKSMGLIGMIRTVKALAAQVN